MNGSPLPEWMKPSNAKVIVLFNQSNWQGYPAALTRWHSTCRKLPSRGPCWNGTAVTGWVENGSEYGRTRMYCYGVFSATATFGPATGGRAAASEAE